MTNSLGAVKPGAEFTYGEKPYQFSRRTQSCSSILVRSQKSRRTGSCEFVTERMFNEQKKESAKRAKIHKAEVQLVNSKHKVRKLEDDVSKLQGQVKVLMKTVEELRRRVFLEGVDDSGAQTPPIEYMEEDAVTERRVEELFAGLKIPMRETALLKSLPAYLEKLLEEKERIKRQGQEDAKKSTNVDRVGKFEFFIQRGLTIPDNVISDQAGFATLEGNSHKNEDRYLQYTFDAGSHPVSVFAIFDGHGGGRASTFCMNNFAATLQECWRLFVTKGKDYTIANALTMACVRLDAAHRAYMESKEPTKRRSGTTACIVLKYDHQLLVANVGDSRAILCTPDPQRLTYDFRASDPFAQQTVINRGGKIKNERVVCEARGSLGVTRAIGDEYLRGKNDVKPISCRPKIMHVDCSELGESTLILMTDGLSDVASMAAIARQTARLRKEGKSENEIAQLLVVGGRRAAENIIAQKVSCETHARKKKGYHIDDITAGVVFLK